MRAFRMLLLLLLLSVARTDVGAPSADACRPACLGLCVCVCFNQTCWKKFWVGSHPTWFQMFFLPLQSEHRLSLFIGPFFHTT